LQNLTFDLALDRIPVVYPVDRWNDGQTSGIKSIMNVTLPNWPELYTVERPFGGKPAIVTSPIWTGFLKNLFKHIWPEAQDKHLYAALKRIAKGYTKPANPALDEMIESSNETTTVTRTSPSKERKTTSIPGTEVDTKKSKRTYAITKKASKKTKAADDDYDSEDAISVDTSTDVEHTVETPKKKQKGNDGHPKHVHMPEDTGEVDPPSRSKDLLNIVQAAEKTATEEKKKKKNPRSARSVTGESTGKQSTVAIRRTKSTPKVTISTPIACPPRTNGGVVCARKKALGETFLFVNKGKRGFLRRTWKRKRNSCIKAMLRLCYREPNKFSVFNNGNVA